MEFPLNAHTVLVEQEKKGGLPWKVTILRQAGMGGGSLKQTVSAGTFGEGGFDNNVYTHTL